MSGYHARGFYIYKQNTTTTMKNDFVFSKACCTTFLFKRELLELTDGTENQTEMVPMTSINKSPLNDYEEPRGPINGKLWHNRMVYVCCDNVCCCCGTTSYEIQGYGAKLAEVRTNCCYTCSASFPFCDHVALQPFNMYHCCCPRKYLVEDWQGGLMGDLTYSCCQMVCCVTVTVANKTDPSAYIIKPQCCVCLRCCGAGKWFITDSQQNAIGEITKPCCTWYPRYEYSFKSQLSPNDKVILMASIPHLP